jgi:hypothetical protein
MQRTMVRFMTLMGALLLLVTPSAIGQSQAPPPAQKEVDIVEAARKARELKKSQPKAKVVLTNDDLVKPAEKKAEGEEVAEYDELGNKIERPKPAQPAEGAEAGAETQAAAPAAEQKRFGGLTEEEWRKKFSDLRAKIAAAEKEADLLQRELNLNQVQYYSDPNKAVREQYTRNEINSGTAKVDAKKQEVAALKQQLAELEDQLRKAGGPSGWSRE